MQDKATGIQETPPPQMQIQAMTERTHSVNLPQSVWNLTWPEGLLLLMIFCQIALLLPGLAGMRAGFRCAAFTGSLALLLKFGPSLRHPAALATVCVLSTVALGLLHPSTNGLLGGLVTFAMYVAIISPVLWAVQVKMDPHALRRMVMILWFFHTLSALFGVLQIYYPGSFQPAMTSVLADKGAYLSQLYIKLADGSRVLRPMGLTDSPGGAATSGFYAVLLGVGILLTERKLWKYGSLGGITIGLFCLYLSQVRSFVVMTGICLLVLLAVMHARGRLLRAMSLLVLLVPLVAGSYFWAQAVGGDSVTKRLGTLVEMRPDAVYQANRGKFLRHTIDELVPEYPLGAGLARWGMMAYYFGDTSHNAVPQLYAEIQWTGWVLDGGIPLVMAYSAALLWALLAAWRIALRRRDALGDWANIIVAYNVGALALCFNSAFFMSQTGLECWLLNGVLMAVFLRERKPVREVYGTA